MQTAVGESLHQREFFVDSSSRALLCTFLAPGLRRLFFLAYFCPSPLQMHVKKAVGGFEKKNCVSTGMRKPGNTYVSPTSMI